jgi:hypothetical protein
VNKREEAARGRRNKERLRVFGRKRDYASSLLYPSFCFVLKMERDQEYVEKSFLSEGFVLRK